jgi:hypothetical protein
VPQQSALLPDGSLDPANQTDCGEACLSIVAVAAGQGYLSPGCFRQWLGKPESNGVTTAEDLSIGLARLRIRHTVEEISDTAAEDALRHFASVGQLAIILGSWEFPQFDHWMVSGRLSDNGVWVSDPWTGSVRDLTWDTFSANFFGVLVAAHGR